MKLVTPIPIITDVFEETHYGIRALWVRVIIRALCDFVTWKKKSDLKSKREFQAVKKWLFDDDSSLLAICDLLDINVSLIRERALEMTPKDVRKFEHKDRNSGVLLDGLCK